jgi:hypothetical protein
MKSKYAEKKRKRAQVARRLGLPSDTPWPIIQKVQRGELTAQEVQEGAAWREYASSNARGEP